MRKMSSACVAIVLAIALYFALVWGYEALRILTSPSYGLDDVFRSQYIFALGQYASLGPIGLIKLAAFFATLKLAAAGICVFYILDRLLALTGGKAGTDLLEVALILIVAITIASVGASVWSHSVELLREQTVQLLLATVAIGLSIVERSYGRADEPAALTTADAGPAQNATWFTPWRR